jgi:hypothetical protein
MIESMEPREKQGAEEASPIEKDRSELPAASIPACGTLCDAFWWARRSQPPKSAD